MINSVNYSNRKGIYKDLYREIDADNKKKETSQVKKQPKGIYKDLYRQLDEDKSVSFKASEQQKKAVKKDKESIWHTYPLKGIAYSNDLGEALRPIIGGALARLSWVPTIFYALLAVLSKCFSSDDKKSSGVEREVLFQLFASFLLPLLLVKSVGKVTHKVIDNLSAKTKDSVKNTIKQIDWLHKFGERFKNKEMSQYRTLAESGAGLFALAFAVKPIDNFVDKSLDRVYNRG